LVPNSTQQESTYEYISPTSTGFTISNQNASATYVYVAIRRGPMKPPTSGTSVFLPTAFNGDSSNNRVITTNFVTDWVIGTAQNFTGANRWTLDRMRGANVRNFANLTNGDVGPATGWVISFASSTGYLIGTDGDVNSSSYSYIQWAFRRASGFFDIVCYTGTGSPTTINHNLGAVPEMMIVKIRSGTDSWIVYHSALGATRYALLNASNASAVDSTMWNNTAPTSSVFSIGSSPGTATNISGSTYIAYLFASVAGVSKVGTYTGTGATQQINCGFTNGARFVMIKRTSTGGGDWYIWDSARGIVAGNDPYSVLNSTAAQVTNTDYVDTYSAGFEISSTAPAEINANGGTFIFLAIA